MEKEKYSRTINALKFGAVLLLVILLGILIYQLVSLKIYKNDVNELKDKIAYYNTLTETERETIEARSTLEWIEQRARELGLSLDGDIRLND